MIYFVTTSLLTDTVPISGNVDVNDYLPLIKYSADSYVRNYLGTYFYTELLTKYNNQTLNADEITLVELYIQSSVAWRTLAESVLSVSFQLKNKGLQTQNGDFSTSPDFKTIAFISHQYKDKADFYDNRLRVYLTDNKDLYPEFISNLNTDSILKPFDCDYDNTSFQSGIIFI